MEIKVVCDCGQKFKFDVEAVNGQMPFTVTCPACGADGTAAANAVLAQTFGAPPAIPAAAPIEGRIPFNRPAQTAAPASVPPSTTSARIPLPNAAAMPPPKAAGEFNLGLGIVGALVGAGIGVGVMYGFYEWAGFRFPLLGVGIGVLTGFGAKQLYKGTGNMLGAISGGIALLAVVGALYLMYGVFPLMSIISVIVSVSMAYRIASG